MWIGHPRPRERSEIAMHARVVLSILLASVLLVGCQGLSPRGEPLTAADVPADQTLRCRSGDDALHCQVLVLVPWCSPFGCRPDVDFPKVEVSGGANRITWVLASPSRRWLNPGIVFDVPGFVCDPPAGRIVVCGNDGRRRDVGAKYRVRIDGLKELDPWVVNN
ncbi:MAG: hypothetical protein ABI920_14350 [Casimicrobiaceae bacterium]